MAELALADRMRVSHSHLKGGPALWTPEDVEKSLAYRAYDAGRCPRCGLHKEEQVNGHHTLEAYVDQCAGCEDIGRLQDAVMKDRPASESHGIVFGLRVPVEEPTA